MSQVIHWTEIEGFHNIRKYALAHPEILNGNSKVQYRAKVKLHGSNCAVQAPSTSWAQVQKPLTEKARACFLIKTKK